MTVTRYIALPLFQAQAPRTQRWSRRAMHATLLVLASISAFALFEYGIRLAGDTDISDFDGAPSEAADTSLDAAYLPFRPDRRPAVSQSLKPSNELPQACLDAHITHGALCFSSADTRLDILWTWVNGSDILLQDAKLRVENSFPPDAAYRPTTSWKKDRQYRDHDELRFSMRSVLKNFRQSTSQFHLLTADFGIPQAEPHAPFPEDYRLGQVPQWLKVKESAWIDDNVTLSTVHHAEIFQPYNDSIFNSYAIESQFGHLQGISENFIYMNDDFFFLGPVTERTFYTSAYGLVVRMQSDLLVSPTQYPNNVRGEWRSLAASNALLSERFGARHRPYVTHEAKGASLSILHEISQIWKDQLAKVAIHPFRETKLGESDPSMMFLMVHFVVERWREALLWSWVVGKHGGLDGTWTEDMTAAAWADLGGRNDSWTILNVKAEARSTLDPERVSANLRASGLKQTDPTTYSYSSQDGYPYTSFTTSVKNQWPKFSTVESKKRIQCPVVPNECFRDQDGNPFTRASDLFKNIAFNRLVCGDCIITALVNASGETGLRAFLPDPSRALSSLAGKIPSPAAAEDVVPHLPLLNKWQDGLFSLQDVMSSSRHVSVRDFTLRLLQRYRFVIGETPSHFAMLGGPSDMMSLTRRLKSRPETALLCINDDVVRDNDKVTTLFKKWALEQWSQPAAWER